MNRIIELWLYLNPDKRYFIRFLSIITMFGIGFSMMIKFIPR